MEFVVLDTETTGLSVERGSRLIEVAGVRIKDWRLEENGVFESLINPGCMIPVSITGLTGISDLTVKTEKPVDRVLEAFFEFLKDSVLVMHNAAFDLSFLNHFGSICGLGRVSNPFIDTMELSRHLFHSTRNNLDVLLARLAILPKSRHRALGDALATAEAFLSMSERIGKENVNRFIRKGR